MKNNKILKKYILNYDADLNHPIIQNILENSLEIADLYGLKKAKIYIDNNIDAYGILRL